MAKMIPLEAFNQEKECQREEKFNNKSQLRKMDVPFSIPTGFFQVRFLKSGKIISHFGDLPPMKALYEMAKQFHEHVGVFVGDLKICDTSWHLPNLEVCA